MKNTKYELLKLIQAAMAEDEDLKDEIENEYQDTSEYRSDLADYAMNDYGFRAEFEDNCERYEWGLERYIEENAERLAKLVKEEI